MNTHSMALRTIVAIGMSLSAFVSVAQYTGTSHPDEVPVTTTNDGMRQPLVYVTSTQTSSGRVAVSPSASFMVGVSAPSTQVSPSQLIAPAGKVYPGRPASFAGDSDTVRDVDGSIVTHLAEPGNGLPSGTLLNAKLLQDLSTKATREGMEWRAELLEPLARDGRVLIPAGTMLRGRVTEVHGGKRISGEASIHLQCLSLVFPDGTARGLHAQVIDTNLYHETKVNREGTILRRDHRKEEGGVLALTAGSGAAAGGVLGGVPGALVGASLGAGVSAALWLRQDRQVELPHDTKITLELTRPLLPSLE